MSDPKRSALASMVGTALEWYDFILYGMTSALSDKFGAKKVFLA